MLFRCKVTLFILYLKTFVGKKTKSVHFSPNTVALPLYIYTPCGVFLAVIPRKSYTLSEPFRVSAFISPTAVSPALSITRVVTERDVNEMEDNWESVSSNFRFVVMLVTYFLKEPVSVFLSERLTVRFSLLILTNTQTVCLPSCEM